MWPENLCDFWPSHKFWDGEEFEELGVKRHFVISTILLDTVEEVGLFIIVWGQDNIVDDSLQNLAVSITVSSLPYLGAMVGKFLYGPSPERETY